MMKNMLFYFYISMCSTFAYKKNFVGFFFLTLFIIFFRIMFTDSLFQFTETIGGWSVTELYNLVIIITYISLLTHTFSTSVNIFFQHMLMGKIDPLFMQPIPIIFHMTLRWMNFSNLIIFIILNIYIALPFSIIFFEINYYNILSVCVTVICSVIANIGFVILLNSFSLLGQKLLPVEYIHVELNKIQIIPPTLFQQSTFQAIIFFMPIIVSAGVTILAIKQPFSFTVILFWFASVLLFLTSYSLFQFVFKRRIMQGG